MAMLTRRPGFTAPITAFDPFRMMREFMRTGVDGDLEEVGGDFVPEFEMKEKDDAFVLKGDVPGVKEGDIDISCAGQSLTVSGKREEEAREEGERYYRYERSFGSFSRTFTLPETADLDKASASLDAGVLTVTMPKRESAKARKISVSKSS
jgi:HSP20 family protein